MLKGFKDSNNQIYVFFSQKVGSPLKPLSCDESLSLGNGCMATSVFVGVLQAVKRVLIQAGKHLAENEKEIRSSIKCPQ